jgi:hypothetical protein
MADRKAVEEYKAMEELKGTGAAASSTSQRNHPSHVNTTRSVAFTVSNDLIIGCHFCRQVNNTSRCGGCKVVYYCSQEHQAMDRAAHKASCNRIKKERIRLEAQEVTLRAHAGDVDTPPNAFEEGREGIGRFWGYKGTRPYMKGRYSLIDTLLEINTTQAVETALEHCMDMLRLNHSDNQGIRTIIPALYLRLGRDQECYDFLKWWLVHGFSDDYEWGDRRATIKDQDAFEPVIDFLKGFLPLEHLVSLALLKIRMLIDMRAFQKRSKEPEPRTPVQCVSSIVAKDYVKYESGPSHVMSDWLRKLVVNLYVAVHCANPHFWPALLNPGNNLTVQPDGYMMGTKEEMQTTLRKCYNSWAETSGAFAVVEEMSADREVMTALQRFSEQ